MTEETLAEHTDFPKTGSRARRWTRFERDLYDWMNRPEGKFVCWLAERQISGGADECGCADGSGRADGSDRAADDILAP